MLFYASCSVSEAASLPLHPSPELQGHLLKKTDQGSYAESRAAYALLESLMVEHACFFRELPFPPLSSLSFRESQKPLLSHYYCSIAHSDGIVAAAVSDLPVGIDVECEGKRIDPSRLRRRYFPESEQAVPLFCDEAEERAEFYRLFTAKEAYLKAKDMIFPTAMRTPLSHFRGTLLYEKKEEGGRVYHLSIYTE